MPARYRSISLTIGLFVALTASAVTLTAGAHSTTDPDARRGIVLDGLLRSSKAGPCRGNYAVGPTATGSQCSHGPDPAPNGVDVTDRPSAAELAAAGESSTAAATTALPVPCYGDGTSGFRVQAIYARSADVADRFASVSQLMPGWAGRADAVFSDSAAETGGSRHVRWVTTTGCKLAIANVVLSTAGDDTLQNTINELKAKGYNRTDRKYLVWTDAATYCGIGTIYHDDRAASDNWNNRGPSFARVDAACWGFSNSIEAHELMHNLGGVQLTAPHATIGFHCTDESDRMCYPDGTGAPLQYVCPSTKEVVFDCGDDDYYNTAPAAGSYLASHWNAANSGFLSSLTPDAWSNGPAPSMVTTTSNSYLTTTTSTRRYTVYSGAGTLTARVSNTKGIWMTISLRRSDGTLIVKKYGATPVKITATVPAGSYVVSVNAKPVAFTLTVTRPAP